MQSPSPQQVGLPTAGGQPIVDTDITVQAFAQWLTEMRTRNTSNLQQMLSEMAIIRDGITSNNTDLTEFKRHSTGISQQMQSQLTDLREKLTNAFGEITSLVKQKTVSDQEMMQDINSLQQNLSYKTAELEALKRSYSQTHQQLQNSLIQIQNHLSITTNEIQHSKVHADNVQRETVTKFSDIDQNLKRVEDSLSLGNTENRNQMLQLQEEIARIHESLTSVSAEFMDHKRSANSVHNKLQSQIWALDESNKTGGAAGGVPRQASQGALQDGGATPLGGSQASLPIPGPGTYSGAPSVQSSARPSQRGIVMERPATTYTTYAQPVGPAGATIFQGPTTSISPATSLPGFPAGAVPMRR